MSAVFRRYSHLPYAGAAASTLKMLLTGELGRPPSDEEFWAAEAEARRQTAVALDLYAHEQYLAEQAATEALREEGRKRGRQYRWCVEEMEKLRALFARARRWAAAHRNAERRALELRRCRLTERLLAEFIRSPEFRVLADIGAVAAGILWSCAARAVEDYDEFATPTDIVGRYRLIEAAGGAPLFNERRHDSAVRRGCVAYLAYKLAPDAQRDALYAPKLWDAVPNRVVNLLNRLMPVRARTLRNQLEGARDAHLAHLLDELEREAEQAARWGGPSGYQPGPCTGSWPVPPLPRNDEVSEEEPPALVPPRRRR